MNLLERAKKEEDWITKIRRDLHRMPEILLELPKTMDYIRSVLDSLGIGYTSLMDGNAVVATIEGAHPGKCIAIRADADALPVCEETGLPFASENGNMHACGHDSHVAIALGAAKMLMEEREKLHGTVKFLFQPGEEFPGGAQPMIDEGALENPHVDRVIGLHGGCLFPVPHGKIGVKKGPMMASMDRFKITVKGKGTHGATPQLGRDPIPCIAEIVGGVQKVVSRMVDPLESALVSICQIHAGSTMNIIPEEAWLEGTVRTFSEEVRKMIAEDIQNIAHLIARAYGMEAEIEYDFKYPVLVNDPAYTEAFAERAKALLGEDNVVMLERPSLAGEDMAAFLRHAEGTFFTLSNAKTYPDGSVYPHHNPKFDLDEEKFYIGTALFVMEALHFLGAE